MLNKHFLKTLILFTIMILVGLLGIFLVGHFGQGTEQGSTANKDCGSEKC